jgi:hypothetical protein
MLLPSKLPRQPGTGHKRLQTAGMPYDGALLTLAEGSQT